MDLASARELKDVFSRRTRERFFPLLSDEKTPPGTNVVFHRLSPGFIAQNGEPILPASPAISFGIGYRPRKGFRITVFIQDHRLRRAREVADLKKLACGEIDIEYLGSLKLMLSPSWCQQKHRPLHIGTSVGHHKNGSGTLTCFVKDRKADEEGDRKIHLLSCNHVLT